MSAPNEELTDGMESFCIAFTSEGDTCGHITKSYAQAYGYDLPRREDNAIDTTSSQYNVCAVEGSKLMRLPKIQKRIQSIYYELYNNDEFFDSVLGRIAREGNNSDKISATKHRNELKQRITKKIDVTSANRPLVGLSDDELARLAGA